MKIIQIGPFPLDKSHIRGGVESSVFGLAQEQSVSDEVIVIDTPRLHTEDKVEYVDKVKVYRLKNVGPHQVDAKKRVKDIVQIILSERPYICHIHGTEVFCKDLFFALKQSNVRTIVTVHGLVGVEKKKDLKKAFSIKKVYQLLIKGEAERLLLGSIDNVIVDTAYVKKALLSYRLKNVPNCHIIPQGINKRFFKLSCSKSSHEILSVGAISRRKSHLLLIQSFEKVCNSIPTAHLTICGHIADPTYYSEIMDYLAGSRYRNRVEIITNAGQDLLEDLYSRAHVFALHSQEESQGIVLAEAMAAGLPVVSTKVGGIPDVIENGRTGLLTSYGDLDSFAISLTKMLEDHNLWQDMSNHCREEAVQYSWASIAEQVKSLYEHIL